MHTVHYHDNDSEDTLTYVECTQCSEIKIYLQQNYFVSISLMVENLFMRLLEIEFIQSKVNVSLLKMNFVWP